MAVEPFQKGLAAIRNRKQKSTSFEMVYTNDNWCELFKRTKYTNDHLIYKNMHIKKFQRIFFFFFHEIKQIPLDDSFSKRFFFTSSISFSCCFTNLL